MCLSLPIGTTYENWDTIDQMASVAAGMIGKRLMCRDLIS